jgi:hypothetical protein
MGLRSFLHRLYAKVKEVLTGTPSKYRNFRCVAWFDNGATAQFEGVPWGSNWRDFRSLLEDPYEPANAVWVNMDCGNWMFS